MIRLWVYPTARNTSETVEGECGSPSQPGSSESCGKVFQISHRKASGESTIRDVTATRKLGLKTALSLCC